MKEIGFGLIGTGNIAPIHARSLSEIDGARLIAVAGSSEAKAQALAEEYGAQAFGDYREMIAKGGIDAVTICTPSGTHGVIGEACAKAGKHVLVEKPLEITGARIDHLVRAAEEAGVLLGCIFQSRFAEGPRAIKAALDAGRFGDLVLGDAYIKWYRSQAYYESGAWRGTKELDGGGALMNQGIHQIDLLLWFMGPAKRVYAKTALRAHDGLEVEDLACAVIEFENGALGVIEGSTAVWHGHPARVEVHGTRGSAVLEDGTIRSWHMADDGDVGPPVVEAGVVLGSGSGDPLEDLKHEGHRRQIEDFVQAIREGRPPFVEGAEGRRAVALVEAIYASAESGLSCEVE